MRDLNKEFHDLMFGNMQNNGSEPAATAEEIKAAGMLYLEKNEFKLGDLITWKDGMRDCRFPEYGKPAVVIDILVGQRSATDDSGNHENEPWDVRIGLLMETVILMVTG